MRGETWIPDERRGSDLVCGELALCDRCGRLRGESEVAGRSLRCLRSLSYFELAHSTMTLSREWRTFPESFGAGGAVLRLLKRPSSFLLTSLIVNCPNHARRTWVVDCRRRGRVFPARLSPLL